MREIHHCYICQKEISLEEDFIASDDEMFAHETCYDTLVNEIEYDKR